MTSSALLPCLPLCLYTQRLTGESAIASCLPVWQMSCGLATAPCLGECPHERRPWTGLYSGYTGFRNYGAMLSRLGSALASSRQAQGPLGNMADEMDCCTIIQIRLCFFNPLSSKRCQPYRATSSLTGGFPTANCWESLLPTMKALPSKSAPH